MTSRQFLKHSPENWALRCLTKTQIQVLKNRKKKAMYTEEDLARAIVLKVKLPAAYRLVRNSWHFPLPGISTLQRYISQIHFTPGILHPVMSFLHQYFQSKPAFSKQC